MLFFIFKISVPDTVSKNSVINIESTMPASSKSETQPENEADEKNKLIYIPPILTVLSILEVENKQLGVAENLSGSGLFS